MLLPVEPTLLIETWEPSTRAVENRSIFHFILEGKALKGFIYIITVNGNRQTVEEACDTSST